MIPGANTTAAPSATRAEPAPAPRTCAEPRPGDRQQARRGDPDRAEPRAPAARAQRDEADHPDEGVERASKPGVSPTTAQHVGGPGRQVVSTTWKAMVGRDHEAAQRSPSHQPGARGPHRGIRAGSTWPPRPTTIATTTTQRHAHHRERDDPRPPAPAGPRRSSRPAPAGMAPRRRTAGQNATTPPRAASKHGADREHRRRRRDGGETTVLARRTGAPPRTVPVAARRGHTGEVEPVSDGRSGVPGEALRGHAPITATTCVAVRRACTAACPRRT